MSKQKTLFQSWGNQTQKKISEKPSSDDASTSNDVVDLCDSFEDGDDELLCEAEFSTNGLSVQDENENPTNISIGAEGFAPTQGESQNTTCPGFDMSAGKLWIYPTNYPVREYQFNIVWQSLFKNTMVTLPTGLGKTFIAAVVMYNFYRWYPQGKVIFMAPTKPLVAQQIEACYNIMGIPQGHTAEMTGSMGPPKREKAWNEKRVFFLTPQVLTNDLSRGSCPAHFVKCLVIDEAHKALGNHAYCQVVRELVKYTEQFRVLALSATPGSDIKAVQQVLSNLLVSHIEIRTEDSIDIKQYSHERIVDKVVVPLGEELTKVKAKYINVMDVIVTKLKRHGVLYNRDTTSLSKFLILKARDAFRQNPPERLQRSQYGVVEGDFALAMSLYHGYELLQLHGSRSLYNFLEGILTGDKGYGRTRAELSRNGDFNELIDMLRQKYSAPQNETPSQAQSRPFVIGHPKMEKLQEIVLEHFKKFEASNATTRVMIFSQYRDSVQEITDMLNLHRPLIKVMSFIGQSSAGKSTKGFTQKEQLKVMKEFREGGYNTLVSTCVGEEGLDIGDVDLIICFDAHKSPIRLVQRMGRTGRKREGRIVMLVTQGKEEQIYNQSQFSKRSIHRAILNGAKSLHFYQHSVRMVPDSVNPVVHKMHITVNENFKPTKKLNTDQKPEKTAKISSLFSKDKQDISDGLITREEYEELKPWLVPEETIPKLQSFDLVCLSKDQEDSREEFYAPQGCFLSLSEWSPWQTTLQETSDWIDHSKQAKHYVELMEFIQLQSSLDKDTDPYGLEMAAYLNEEDINTKEKEISSESNSRICDSMTCQDGKGGAAETADSNTKDPKRRKRHSDMLPSFDLEVNEVNEESEDELPSISCFMHHIPPNRSDDKPFVNRESSHYIPEFGNASDTMFKIGKKSDMKDLGFNQSNITVDRKIDETSKSKRRKSEFVTKSKAKALDEKMRRVVKAAKHKKISGFNRSVIELLKTTDENDFDSTPPDKFTNKATLNDPVDLTLDDNLITTDSSFKCNVHTLSSNKKGYQRHYVIRTPPTVEDAIRHCEAAGLEADRVKVDLLELIDEWHRENENGKYLVLAPREDSRCFSNTMNTFKKGQKMSKSNSDICINPVAISKDLVQCKEGDQENSSREIKEITPKYNTHNSDSVSTRLGIIDHEAEVKNEVGYKQLVKKKYDSNNGLSEIDTNQDPQLSDSFTPMQTDYIDHETGVKNEVSEKQVARKKSEFDNSVVSEIDTNQDIELTGSFTPIHTDCIENIIDTCKKDTKIDSMTNCERLCDQKMTVKDNKSLKKQKSSFILESDVKLSSKNKSLSRLFEKVDVKMSDLETEDSDDDLFGNFTTPDVSCVKEACSPRFSRGTGTQFTFTQALDCLHSGSIASESGSSDNRNEHNSSLMNKELVVMKSDLDRLSSSCDCSVLEDKTCVTKKTGKKFTNNDVFENSDSRSQPSHVNNSPKIQVPDVCSNLRRPSTSSDDGNLPQFDLGFDIDEDIIPPSPDRSQPFQCTGKNHLSQTFTSRLSQSRLLSNFLCDGSKNEQNKFSNSINVDIQHSKSKRSLRLEDDRFTGLRLEPLEEEKESQSLLHSDNSVCITDKTNLKSLRDLTRTDKLVIQKPLESKENFSETKSCITENIVIFEGDRSLDKRVEMAAEEDNFESSFALVDDDFDEWLNSQTENLMEDGNKNNDVRETSVEKLSSDPVNREKILDRNQACISSSNLEKAHTNLDKDTKKKKKLTSHNRKSVFCPSDLSFEDSFSFHDNCGNKIVIDNISNSRKPRKLENTSTPVGKTGSVKVKSSPKENPVEFNMLKESVHTSGAANIEEQSFVDTDMDDSFVIRKKRKKVALLESPISQVNAQSKGNKNEINKQTFENTDVSWSEDDDFDDKLLMKNNNYFGKTSNIVHINSGSEEDFENVPQSHSKSDNKSNIGYKKNPHNSGSKSNREMKRKSKSKRPSNPFLEEEAEISEHGDDEATSDETDASDLDQYDDSFIHDSQFSQSQGLDQTDIHALYLKSVKSPVNDMGGFKLQYNHKNINVYSQVPREDESQYMEDSFCVGSEEDDWLAEDDFQGEITVFHNRSTVLQSGKKRRKGASNLQTGRQRAIHFGRMKALNEIKTKLAKKNKCEKGKLVQSKQVTEDEKLKLARTTRIKILEESSSDEDVKVTNHGGVNITSPTMHNNKKRKRVRLLSSSDEEIQKSKLVCSQQIQHTGEKTWTLSLNQSLENNEKSTRKMELGRNVLGYDPSSDEFGKKRHSFGNKMREERLQKQKVQQEEFRRKMAEANVKKVDPIEKPIDKEYPKMTKIKDISSKDDSNVNCIRDFDDPCLLLNHNPQRSNSACILVDSKEISGAQDIISNLRFKHKIQVSAAQLPGCDYIISNRMAVERKQWSDFSNGANRTRLVERIQHLRDLYDRACLIIEKDRVKSDDGKSEKPVHWTKYIDRTCSMLLKSNIKLLYTDTQTETASVLAELCLLEKRKNMNITVPVELGPLKTDMVKFYSSFPKLSYIHALNLCDGFKSVSQFLKSTVTEIERKGKMSSNRATEVFNYIERNFDLAMLPSKHK